MRRWLSTLAPRERRLVTGAAVFVGALLVWALLVEPLQQRRAVLESGLATQRETLAWLQQVAPQVRGSAAIASRDESLFSVVDRSARATVLAGALQRVQPAGEASAQVWFEDASFDALVHWIGALQTEHGIRVTALAAERGDGAGLVDARLTVERGP